MRGLSVVAAAARFRTPTTPRRFGLAPVAHGLSHGDAGDHRDSRGEDRLPPRISSDVVQDIGEIGLIDIVCESVEAAGVRSGYGLKMRQVLVMPAKCTNCSGTGK